VGGGDGSTATKSSVSTPDAIGSIQYRTDAGLLRALRRRRGRD